MQRSMLLAMAAVIAVAAVPVIATRLGGIHRAQLLQYDEGYYNTTLKLLSITNLSNITNSTIFSPSDEQWFLQGLPVGILLDKLIAKIEANASALEYVTQMFMNRTVAGLHPSSEFSPNVTYYTINGNNITVFNISGDGRFDMYEGGYGPVEIVKTDKMWQGNLMQVYELER